MSAHGPSYIPALRFHALTRVYDPVVRWTTRESRFKPLLVEQANVGSGSVLDLGCGTATLTVALKRRYPDARVFGLDADAQALAIARRKVEEAGVDIELRQGLAADAPFEPHGFDRVVSSLFFHHLTTGEKVRVLSKVRDLLRCEGELHVADWGRPANTALRVAFLGVQLLDGFETTRDSVRGRLPTLMREAGFRGVTETRHLPTPLGTITLYRATAA